MYAQHDNTGMLAPFCLIAPISKIEELKQNVTGHKHEFFIFCKFLVITRITF
jgi:hypothetical protein